MYLFGGISGKSLADFDEIPLESVTIEDFPLVSTPIKISGSLGSVSEISNSNPSSPGSSIKVLN